MIEVSNTYLQIIQVSLIINIIYFIVFLLSFICHEKDGGHRVGVTMMLLPVIIITIVMSLLTGFKF